MIGLGKAQEPTESEEWEKGISHQANSLGGTGNGTRYIAVGDYSIHVPVSRINFSASISRLARVLHLILSRLTVECRLDLRWDARY